MVEQWVKDEAKDNLGKKLGPLVHTVAASIMRWINQLGSVYYSEVVLFTNRIISYYLLLLSSAFLIYISLYEMSQLLKLANWCATLWTLT